MPDWQTLILGKKSKLILWWILLTDPSWRGGGVKGDKMPRPNKTNREASPGSPVHPLHGLTMVTMEPICQFHTSRLCEERRASPSAPSLMFDGRGEGAPQTRAEDACVS